MSVDPREPKWRITFIDDAFRISMSELDVKVTELGMSIIEWDHYSQSSRATLYPWHCIKAVTHATEERNDHAW